MRDEKTRHKTAAGEKPKLAEYLVMVQLAVRRTTVASHGHTLGVFTHVMRSYCAACKAGCGMCYHRASLMWMQHLHWGEGRPTPKPATASFCSWIPGSRAKRTCSSLVAAANLSIERLPHSNEEAKAKLDRNRQYNLREGVDARYDVFAGNEKKWEALKNPEFVSAIRLARLFAALRSAQGKCSAGEEEEED